MEYLLALPHIIRALGVAQYILALSCSPPASSEWPSSDPVQGHPSCACQSLVITHGVVRAASLGLLLSNFHHASTRACRVRTSVSTDKAFLLFLFGESSIARETVRLGPTPWAMGNRLLQLVVGRLLLHCCSVCPLHHALSCGGPIETARRVHASASALLRGFPFPVTDEEPNLEPMGVGVGQWTAGQWTRRTACTCRPVASQFDNFLISMLLPSHHNIKIVNFFTKSSFFYR